VYTRVGMGVYSEADISIRHEQLLLGTGGVVHSEGRWTEDARWFVFA
jgi:hypothetical protein